MKWTSFVAGLLLASIIATGVSLAGLAQRYSVNVIEYERLDVSGRVVMRTDGLTGESCIQVELAEEAAPGTPGYVRLMALELPPCELPEEMENQ